MDLYTLNSGIANLKIFLVLVIILGCVGPNNEGFQEVNSDKTDTLHFSFTTYDSLELPAQLIGAPGSRYTLLFLNGSTPYDEKGNLGNLLPDGRIIKSRQDFYRRFIDVMSKKGYQVATYAKRSFSYPQIRPSLDDLALDGKYFINELERNKLMKDLIIVGYSEGSVVASKLLPKVNAESCILLGSGSLQYDYLNGKWENWPIGIAHKRILGKSDEEIRREYEQWSQIMRALTGMDEAYFENTYKRNNPFNYGFAPWESLRIDRDLQFYNPIQNITNSVTPLLIISGENDLAMPVEFAKRTYDELILKGHDAIFYTIPQETHQFLKYDVFAIMHSWINGNINLDLDEIDERIIERYVQITNITAQVNELPYNIENPHLDTIFRAAVAADYNIADHWFKLALILFNNSFLDEALIAFEKASDPDFAIYYAPLVWRGHLHDLSGQRVQAIQFYKEALEHYPGFPVQHDHMDLILTEEYIQSRLTEPFVGVK